MCGVAVEQTEDAFLTVRIPPAVRDELKLIADANYRTLAAEIRLALDRHIAAIVRDAAA